jgi:hypothetical protein
VDEVGANETSGTGDQNPFISHLLHVFLSRLHERFTAAEPCPTY